VEWLNLLLYGPPGVGKTHECGTAEESPLTSPVLFLDVEGGVTTIRRRKKIDVVPIRSVDELMSNYNKLYASIKDGKIYYKTVIVDSLSELADLDMRDIMEKAYNQNPDKVNKHVPSQREWGIARGHVRAIVRAFRDLPCNVIFTAHEGFLQEEGMPTRYFPAFSGKLRQEVPGFMDIVGYMSAENKGGEIERKIQFVGTRRVVAKDRTDSLGDVMINATIPQMWELIHGKNGSKATA
jgi:phage nucleotide-binding protein